MVRSCRNRTRAQQPRRSPAHARSPLCVAARAVRRRRTLRRDAEARPSPRQLPCTRGGTRLGSIARCWLDLAGGLTAPIHPGRSAALCARRRSRRRTLAYAAQQSRQRQAAPGCRWRSREARRLCARAGAELVQQRWRRCRRGRRRPATWRQRHAATPRSSTAPDAAHELVEVAAAALDAPQLRLPGAVWPGSHAGSTTSMMPMPCRWERAPCRRAPVARSSSVQRGGAGGRRAQADRAWRR